MSRSVLAPAMAAADSAAVGQPKAGGAAPGFAAPPCAVIAERREKNRGYSYFRR
jgi:hypothetical protein